MRKLMGINNESKAAKYSSSSDYYAFTTTGTNGEMLTVLGPAKSFSSTNRWIKLTGGYHWAYYVEKSKANFVWASLASGTYDGEQSVTLTAISDDANAQIVYTTDGSEPTAGSAKATNGQVLTIPVGTTVLKAGMLVGGVVKNVIVRNYNIIDFKPYNIKVYVNANEADAAWASAKVTSPHPSINFWIWGGTHKTVKGSWPGDAVTTTETANGKKWFVKEFAITNSNDIVNLVFSVGTGSPQTVDIENIKATTFINISSEKEGGKNKVNVVSTGIDSIVAEQKGNNAPYYYTLSGQRIAKPTQRGIYILNGKKVLVK